MINTSRRRGASHRRGSRHGIVLAACLAGVVGCGGGDPDAIPAVPASGTITHKGKPLESGTVQFVPEKGRAASGTIEGGRFTLTTYKENDGAVPGKHSVGVVSVKAIPGKTKGSEPEMVSVVDKKYASPATSGVGVEVPPGGKSDIVIELP